MDRVADAELRPARVYGDGETATAMPRAGREVGIEVKKKVVPTRSEQGGEVEGRLRAIPVGIRYMAIGALAFSIMSLLVKVAGQRMPSQQVVLARSVVVLALSYGMLRRAGVSPRGVRRRLLLLRGVFGFIALSCFYYAVVHLPLADATVIQYTNPVFVALLAAWVLREHMGRMEVVYVLASLGGVVLIARPSFLFGGRTGGLPAYPVAVALVGAILSAAAYVTVRKLGSTENSLVIVFYFAAVSTVCAIPANVLTAVRPTAVEWLVLLGVGISTMFGQLYMTRGLKRERAGRATAVGYLQIVFAAIWGAMFFAEYPDRWSITGALIIVASTFAIGRRRKVAAVE